jgi:inosine/guanosine/xanthosine phosphorylase family protein
MDGERRRVEQAARALEASLGAAPPTVITLGSGLGPVLDRATITARVSMAEVGLPTSTVPGHAGVLCRATLGGAEVVFLSGRVHRYEGYSMHEVVRYVRAAHAWGVRRLILTCSAGSLVPELAPGQLTLLSDHLDLMGDNPLIGPVVVGERFPDASRAHDPALRAALHRAAVARKVSLRDAVYAALSGPAYESAAEVRMLRILGADLVGMSTVPELLAARSVGLRAAAFGVVSNFGAGVGEGEVDHAAVTRVAGVAAVSLADLLEAAAESGFE